VRFDDIIPSADTAWLTYYRDFQVQIRHNDEVISRKIAEYCSNESFGGRRRASNFLDDLDIEKLSDAYAEFLIIDWKGITDQDGELLPCSTENKRKLLHKNIDFRRWVGDESQNVKNFIPKSSSEEEKKSTNSLTYVPTRTETAKDAA